MKQPVELTALVLLQEAAHSTCFSFRSADVGLRGLLSVILHCEGGQKLEELGREHNIKALWFFEGEKPKYLQSDPNELTIYSCPSID